MGAGVLPPLLQLGRSEDVLLRQLTASILCELASEKSCKEELIRNGGPTRLLLGMARQIHRRVARPAMHALEELSELTDLAPLLIDAGAAPAWKEQVQVLGFDEYTLDEQTHLTVTDENTDSNPNAPSDLWFHSTPAYNPASYAADNPTDPSALTETQKRLAVSFVFLATSQVSL